MAIKRLESHNGITIYFRRLAKHLTARSTRFDLVIGELKRTPGTERALEDIINSAERVTICEELEVDNAVHKLSWKFLARLTLYWAGKRGVPLVFNTHSFDAMLACALIGRIRKDVHVVHMFHLSPKAERTRILKGLFGKLFIRSNARVHFLAISSEIEQALLVQGGIPAKQVRKIFHGVDLSTFRPPSAEERLEARTRFGIGSETCCIAIVARINPQKGHDFLIQALSKIPNAAQRFMVLAVGGGSPEWLERIAKEAGLERVVKLVGQSDPIPALWASDLFILPSRWEGFGLASVEAMACGLPIIRTNAAGALDQIDDGQSGYIVPLGNDEKVSETLAQKIDEIANSDSLRARLGQASRQRAVSLFDIEALLEETRLFLLSLAK